jgi:hypothetical protein
VSIGKYTPSLADTIKYMDIGFFSSRKVVVPKSPLGGTRDFTKPMPLIEIRN